MSAAILPQPHVKQYDMNWSYQSIYIVVEDMQVVMNKF